MSANYGGKKLELQCSIRLFFLPSYLFEMNSNSEIVVNARFPF